jgi:hypothetical protein
LRSPAAACWICWNGPQEIDGEKIARLECTIGQLQREYERLQHKNERLRRQLEGRCDPSSDRRRHPFAGFPKPTPDHRAARRGTATAPKRTVRFEVRQTWEAELPGRCPQCGGEIAETGVVEQYQTEIPEPRVESILFWVNALKTRRQNDQLRKPIMTWGSTLHLEADSIPRYRKPGTNPMAKSTAAWIAPMPDSAA